MLRSVILPGVCILGLVCPLLPLLGSGCAKPEVRPRMAKHGLGIAVYKQLVTVSRAAEAEPPEPESAAEDERANEDAPSEPEPIARTDVPPEPWVHAAPAPDVPPLPAPAKEPEAIEEPPLREVAAVPAAPAAPPAQPEPVAEPVAMEQPAPLPEFIPEPKVVVFVPGAHNTEVAPAAGEVPPPGAVHPSLEAPIVNLVVVAPIIALQALVAPPRERQRLLANASRLAPAPMPLPPRPAPIAAPPRVAASPRVR